MATKGTKILKTLTKKKREANTTEQRHKYLEEKKQDEKPKMIDMRREI